MTMFATLAPFASKGPVHVTVFDAGAGELRVIINQKRKDEDDDTVPLSLSLKATPADLDAQLPLAIAEGAAKSAEPKSVADQVKDQVQANEKAAEEEEDEPARAKPKKKTAAKKTAAKKTAAKKAKPNAAFMQKLYASPALQAIVGAEPLPKTEVTKKIWDYIKKHKLQDATNKRMIKPDEKLGLVLAGKKKVSMFEMTKMVDSHLGKSPQAVAPVITPLIKPVGAEDKKPIETRVAETKAASEKIKKKIAKDDGEKREACLADLRAAIKQFGAGVVRKQYMAMAKTGRSFETVFGSWDKFKEALDPKTLDADTDSAKTAVTATMSPTVAKFIADTEKMKALLDRTAPTSPAPADTKTAPLPGIEPATAETGATPANAANSVF